MKRITVGLIAAITLLFGVFGANGAVAQSAEDDPAMLDAGKAVFESSCAGCHGMDGTGSNTGRPLIDVASEQPDRLVHIASVTNGIGPMPAFGDRLSAEEIDAAVSYVRLAFVSDAAEDPAEPADSDELARTGVNSTQLALFGFALLFGGLLLTNRSRLGER